MRVLIDATSVLLRSAGIKNYTYHWIEHLKRLAGDEIQAFPFLNRLGNLTHESSGLGPLSTYSRLALLYFVNIPGNPAIDWVTSGVDVFHVSNQIRNTPRKTRLTATVHDLTCWILPELHTPGNIRADQSFAEQTLKRAHKLIAVSENSRNDAIRILGIDPDRIRVIYSGVPEAYFRSNERPAARPAAKPYILFVGAIEPRKNIDTLLDAWHLLKPSLREEFDLVVAGATGWRSDRTVQRLEAGMGDVRYLRYVLEHELPGLTAGATAFVYPSLYEGFGFPVAQAMACGVPVITSQNSCLPEVAGPGALFIDPRSPTEIAAAMERLLTSKELRQRLGAAGALHAQRYRWELCAQKSLEFFRAACG
ncbi:MAG: glycosyltransferase family 4 protein [Acidobacteriota bacterium]|nr:glycosyltransferase family 4 protein [Acidobacteriota bacterium]